jgi:hypothetical protein
MVASDRVLTPAQLEQMIRILGQPGAAASLERSTAIVLLQKGAIFALMQSAEPASILALEDTAASNPAQAVRDDALQAISTLAAQNILAARESICNLVLRGENPAAQSIAIRHKYAPAEPAVRALFYLLTHQTSLFTALDPQEELITAAFQNSPADLRRRAIASANKMELADWALVMEVQSFASVEAFTRLSEALPFFRSQNYRELGLNALLEWARNGDIGAIEQVFHLFLDLNYEPAGQAAAQAGLSPADPIRCAEFLFLSGQWERYEQFDFQHTYLASAYSQGDRVMRTRIVAQTRRAGRSEWIQSFSSGRRVRWLADMSDTDWEAVIEHLSHDSRWDSLWQLAQVAAPVWSAKMLVSLAQSDFTPSLQGEQDVYAALVDQATACVGVEIKINDHILCQNEIEGAVCLAASPDVKRLALARPDGTLVIIDIRNEIILDEIPPAGGPIWSISFSPDGEILACACGDDRIRLWRIKDLRMIKVLEGHTSLIKCLAVSPDGLTLASGSFDRTLRLWRFPYGPQTGSLAEHVDEIFTLTYSSDGRFLAAAGSDPLIRVWSLPAGDEIRQMAGHSDTVTSLCLSADGLLLASGSRDQSVCLWTFPEGRLLKIIAGHTAPITAVVIHPERALLASAAYDGTVMLWTLPDARLLHSFSLGPDPVTGLAFGLDRDRLIAVTRQNHVHTWDLKWLIYSRLTTDRPTAHDYENLERALKDKPAPGEKQWLEFGLALLRWRRRYDIEIDEPARLVVGEYDIEL